MKKIIAILLLLAIFCSMTTACNTPEVEYKADIVGEWMSPAVNAAAVFNEDGTGELTLNGIHTATWTYQPDTGKYEVSADKVYSATFATEYDMPILTIGGINFYRPDDYDKAYTLLISRRYEEVIELTAEMTKLQLDAVYDIANGVTIEFTDIRISSTEESDGLLLEYRILNNRTDAITEPLYIEPFAKLFLADSQGAVERSEHMMLATSVDGNSAHTGARIFPFQAATEKTLERFGRVIGAVTIELYGKYYYIDLADYFRSEK